jgi:hypothetical protein
MSIEYPRNMQPVKLLNSRLDSIVTLIINFDRPVPFHFGSTKYIKKSECAVERNSKFSDLIFSSFQHAVVRNINDKNGQMQKQLENVVQEGLIAFTPISSDTHFMI